MKKSMALLSIAALSLFLTACGGSGNQKETEKNTSAGIVETTKEAEETLEAEATGEKELSEAISGTVLAVGDTAESEEHSFTVESIEFTGALKEKRGNVTYNHSSNYALAIKLDFKNLATEAFSRWSSKRVEDVSMEYQGKYNYEGEYWVPVDDIVPLANDTMYIVYEVPESMGDDKEGSIYASFTIDGEDYSVIVQEGSASASTEKENAGKKEVSGELSKGQLVSNEDTFSFEITDLYYTKTPSYKTGSITYNYGTDSYYFVCQLDFQNLDEKAMEDWGTERISDLTLCFADKYNYDGTMWIPTHEIVPLGNGPVFLIFEVAESVETGTDSLVMTFTVDGNEFRVNCR